MEAAGLKSPDLYFTKPTPEDIQRRMQAARPQQQPDMGMQQLQMQMQLANEKARLDGENTKKGTGALHRHRRKHRTLEQSRRTLSGKEVK
ncbi:hypothetical protein [Ensifer sp. LBL]|uniref:hypothetical protein n=1 Tax=Ensifer sp. LBL TaxID=2991056 RepID=UPI003D1B1B81